MVTPLSDGGGVARALALFAAVFDSGLLVVTNFLGDPVVLLVVDFAGAAPTAFFAGAGFAGFVGFTAAFLATAFPPTAAFLRTVLAAGFVAVLPGAAALSGFFAGFATGLFFALAFGCDLSAAPAEARFTALPFAGAFAAFARATGFALLFAIPKPIL